MKAKAKPKVLVVIPSLHTGSGVASHVMNYYKYICSEVDMDFVTYTKIDNRYTDEIKENGGRIFFFKKRMIKSCKEINDFFKEHANEYDIIHCHVLNYGLPYLYYAKKHGIKKRIIHVHSSRYSSNPIKFAITSIVAKFCLWESNVFVACSEQSGKKVYHKKPFKVINNGIELSKFSNGNRDEIRMKLEIDDSTILLGNVGRLAKEKNQVFAIDVFTELKKTDKFKNSKMIIIGKGPDGKKMAEHVEEMGLKDDIFFLDATDNIADYYAAMDCFIFPSLYEGLGMCAIEAQAAGLHCFCSDSLPDEAFASKLAHKLNLNNGVYYWYNVIADCDLTKMNVTEQLDRAGFNIKKESAKLVQYYKNICNEKE